MTVYNVYDLGNGWYDFKDIPQGYIKIHGLNCGTESKALARAKKMLPEGATVRITKLEVPA